MSQAVVNAKVKELRNAIPAYQPWERAQFKMIEAPLVLKKLYNIEVSVTTVMRWCSRGLPLKGQENVPAEQQRRAFLIKTKLAGRVYINKADLVAFLEAT